MGGTSWSSVLSTQVKTAKEQFATAVKKSYQYNPLRLVLSKQLDAFLNVGKSDLGRLFTLYANDATMSLTECVKLFRAYFAELQGAVGSFYANSFAEVDKLQRKHLTEAKERRDMAKTHALKKQLAAAAKKGFAELKKSADNIALSMYMAMDSDKVGEVSTVEFSNGFYDSVRKLIRSKLHIDKVLCL
jgi:hypothetical protein